MQLRNRVALVSALTIGCSANPSPEVDAPRIVEFALESMCPVTGMSLRQAIAAWGRPDSVMVDAGDSVAYFDGPKKTVLGVRLRRDTITSWEAHGVIDSRIAHQQPVWSIRQGEGFKKRVANYIGGRHLPAARQYALWRSCPQPGMSEADLVGSWGEPQERQVLAGRPASVVLLYGFGVEGQHERFVFQNDSLVSISYIGWSPE